MAIAITGADLQSEQLIARLLENDLLLLQSFKQAETLQLEQVLATSAEADGHIIDDSIKTTPAMPPADADADLAFELYVEDARVTSDAAYAQAMQNEANARETMDHQYALQLAAAERYAWKRSSFVQLSSLYLGNLTWTQFLRGSCRTMLMRGEISTKTLMQKGRPAVQTLPSSQLSSNPCPFTSAFLGKKQPLISLQIRQALETAVCKIRIDLPEILL